MSKQKSEKVFLRIPRKQTHFEGHFWHSKTYAFLFILGEIHPAQDVSKFIRTVFGSILGLPNIPKPIEQISNFLSELFEFCTHLDPIGLGISTLLPNIGQEQFFEIRVPVWGAQNAMNEVCLDLNSGCMDTVELNKCCLLCVQNWQRGINLCWICAPMGTVFRVRLNRGNKHKW